MTELPSRPFRPTHTKAPTRRGTLTEGYAPTANIVSTPAGHVPANAVETAMQKFAQLILYGIAMIAIWGGILSIAFSEDATNLNFLILGVGGIVSALMAIGLVEFQRRKGGDELHSVHDYLIGIGFFFSAVGVLWGTRWLIGLAASNGVDWLIPTDLPYSDTDWHPSSAAIYVQLSACIALILAQMGYLDRLKGQTTFGWSVTTFTPLALAFVGMGPWLDWSNNIVSYELGISIISLTALAMWLSLRSNSGVIFAIVAVTSGLIPLMYEMMNDVESSGMGGALSLMIFVIFAQGYLASDNRLRQDLMQWTSALLVGEVIIAMIFARSDDYNLILGFIRPQEIPLIAGVVTIQVVLWLSVMIAYFPATLKRRIPWMPIGLAASLFIIEPQASIIPWVVTMLILPYLLIVSKVTRAWVANWTFIAAGVSYFIQSYLSGGFHYQYLEVVIILALLATGEIGRRKGALGDWAHFVTLGLMVLSESVLFGDDPIIPWGIVLYTIGSSWSMMDHAQKEGDKRKSLEASSALFGSMVMAVILSWRGRLDVPLPASIDSALSGFNITLAIVGLGIYFSMLKFKEFESDLGLMFAWTNSFKKAMLPVFDATTNTWIVPEAPQKAEPTGWGPVARVSLLGPMMLFAIALSSVTLVALATKLHWVLLMIVPIGIIVKEVMEEEESSSHSRMIATWTIFLVALPVSVNLIFAGTDTSQLLITAVVLDGLLLGGPLLVSSMLNNKGISDNKIDKTADQFTLLGLLALGLLDASGGLLFLSMYLLVFSRSLKHRQNLILITAPIAIILFGNRFAWEGAVIGALFDSINLIAYDMNEVVTVFEIPRFSCLIMAITSLVILGKGVVDRRQGLESGATETPVIIPAIWLSLGMIGVMPEAAWLLLSLTLFMGLYSWLSGRIDFIPFMPIALLISFWFGFTADSNFSHFDGGDIMSYTMLGTGLFTMAINRMADNGILFKWADSPVDSTDQVASSFILKSVQGREKLVEVMRYWTLICLTMSWTAFYGIGTLVGAIWVTWEVFVNGHKRALLGMPLLHAMAVWNMMDQLDSTEVSQDAVVGTVMILYGLLMTIIASKPELAWSWKTFDWNDESDYYSWIDTVGMFAVGYFLIGLAWAIGELEIDALMWVMWTLYLSGISIQGFRDETETPWRRGIGSFGVIFSLFMLSTTFQDELYSYVTWMLLGIIAFGFGILYMQRMGESSTVFDLDPINEDVIYMAPNEEMKEEDTQEIEEDTQEIEEDTQDIKEETLMAIPEPVKVKEITASDYDIVLHPSMFQGIIANLKATPHDGYRPIVSILQNGNIKIDFVKI
ncbi:MAG: hypothetical protein ACKVIR_01190 [Candidatus Poseidoniales archaeon]